MIYHGRATLSTFGEDLMGNPVVGPSFEVRAEMRPVNSAETDSGGSVVTRYRFYTPADLVKLLAEAKLEEPDVETFHVEYDGNELSPSAGWERHEVFGRFHHYEAVVEDFSTLG